MSHLPVVGIPADIKVIDGRNYHAAGEKYFNAVADGSGAYPLLIPSRVTQENRAYLASMLSLFDGIF